MSEIDERFHAEWLGLVQPTDGLVVSIPVLVDAQCLERQKPELQVRLAELLVRTPDGDLALADLPAFLAAILGWPGGALVPAAELGEAMTLHVPEGHQTLRPTAAVRASLQGADDASPLALVWDLAAENRDLVGLPLDKPEARTGAWEYPPSAKFDRLLRHARVPIGILTNRTQVRLVYAPHGESSGSITFRLADMATVGGRPILDALVMLLGAHRLWSVAPERQLPAILAESRTRQANVTNELADQVKAAVALLLRGFEAAAERDGRALLDDAYRLGDDHLYGGLLTQLLRLVFVLYAEDRGLLPVDQPLYAANLSVLGLFDELQEDNGAHPDSMSRRFGAYGRLVTLFRALYLGVSHGDLVIPARRGDLFSPHTYPFLEGWRGDPGSAPIVDPILRAETRVPTVDDETVFRVLEKLLYLDRQRLSYRALDVEQIGSVYEALMGYKVVRLAAPAVCLKPARVWLTARELLDEKPALRARWIQSQTGLSKAQAEKVAKAVAGLKKEDEVLAALEPFAVSDKHGGEPRADAGRHVIQPGPERRRTSSHYTPRSLTAPIVEKTLRPLLRAMGDEPSSARILELKICDPAMGSGAFLVEACRFLADQLVTAWTREEKRELVAGTEDVVLVARRLIAQRCLYGVDKNPFAVSLAKLSLWLVTLAKGLPFTFLDHALRHGDSLVGLSFDQITSFNWKPSPQLELCNKEFTQTLDEAIHARQKILALAADSSPAAQKEKEWHLKDAEDALARVRLLGDLIVGAFFSATKDAARNNERKDRLDKVTTWLRSGGPPSQDLLDMQADIRARIPVFHWMAEYPEVFWVKRPDPLDHDRTDGVAWIDAFIGNPPFAGKNGIAEMGGPAYVEWLKVLHDGAHGNSDISAHFLRRASSLLGAHGTMGFVTPKSISEGDTRATGIQRLLADDAKIIDATTLFFWPGAAKVAASVVHLAVGRLCDGPAVLDGVHVQGITSYLRSGAEQADPQPLLSNSGLSFVGCYVLGMGFVLTPEDREALVERNAANAACIFRYVGGEDINWNPGLSSDRFVINFGERSLPEASDWPDLLSIVREKVKPERDQNNREGYKRYWWQYGEKRSELAASLRGVQRCLVNSQVSTHLIFAFQPLDRVFAHTLYVYPIEAWSAFAVMQSRLHDAWAWLTSSTFGTYPTPALRYSSSSSFETFPFPVADPRAVIPELETIGRTLYDARASYMLDAQQGLTQTYNLLKDPACTDPRIEHLRALHLDLDRAVLSTYSWPDIPVPPYATPTTPTESAALQAFEDALIDRLFLLNSTRADQERLAGASPNGSRPKLPRASKPKRPPKRNPVSKRQLPLTDGDASSDE